MEELKEEWRRVKLGEISDFQKGFAFKSRDFVDTGRKIVKVSNLTDQSIAIDSCVCLSENSAEKYGKYSLNFDDIIGSWPTNPASVVGKVIKVPQKAETALLNQNAVRLRGNENILQKYLYYILKYEKFKNYIINTAQGSASQASITQEDIKNYTIDLPPLETQQKIASILSSLDDKIELNSEMNKTLEEMAQTLFKRWFIDFEFPNENGEPYRSSGGKMIESELGEIPEGWRVKTIGDILKFVKGKKPKITSENYSEETPVKYLTIKGFTGDENLFASTEKIILVEKHDIVMVMDGASSGTIYVGKNGVLGSTFSKIESKLKLEWSYLYSILKYFENGIKEHTTGSAIPHTDKAYVEKLKTAIPENIDFLNKLTQTISDIIEKNIQQQEEIISLTQIRDTLLPKLMSGEIEV